MVSQMEVAVSKANGQHGAQKARSKSTSRGNKAIQNKKSNGRKPKEPTGTDIVPVMKLRAIDIVDNGSDAQKTTGEGANGGETPPVLHMPGPATETPETLDAVLASDPSLVTDPELLELLQQLSETIDTANTVLDAAAEVGQPDLAAVEAQGPGGGESASVSEPPAPEEEDVPPLAAQEGPPLNGATPAKAKTDRAGFGLVANAALAGLILAAGAAWLVHTNPWLLDQFQQRTGQTMTAPYTAGSDASKDQSALSVPAKTDAVISKEKIASVPPATPAMAPPSAEPVPMQTRAGATNAAAANEANAEPVRAHPGQAAPLKVALGHVSGGSETSIMAQGLPNDSRLTKGKNLGSGNWLLGASDIDGLAFVAGKNAKEGNHVIEFIAVKSDGSVPETRKITVVVDKSPDQAKAMTKVKASAVASLPASGMTVAKQEPVQDAPTASATDLQPAQPSLSPAEIKALLTRGTGLLSEGDVAGARLLLEYAAERGSKDAMVKLAQSYDPQHLSKLSVRGVKPDTDIAARWYHRAARAGRQ